jgi:mRNA interferase RelE/StbE
LTETTCDGHSDGASATHHKLALSPDDFDGPNHRGRLGTRLEGAILEMVSAAFGNTNEVPSCVQTTSVRELERLPANHQRRVLAKIERLTDDLQGDVKRLTNFTPEYRLRVGDYRVLFEIDSGNINVYRVCHRRDAYD